MSVDFSIIFPMTFIRIIKMANTRIKDRNGNQVLLILVLFERYCAVNADNFNAAAKPINIPKKKKRQ
jgi:hypothetical protein